MPITPKFNLQQDETHVYLEINTPHIRVSQDTLQVVLTDHNQVLHFASLPYLLVLNFSPHSFAENADEECATYDPIRNHGTVTLTMVKKVEPNSKLWENLDLLGTLVQPRKNSSAQTTSRWLKEVTEEVGSPMSNQEDSETASAGVPGNLMGYGFLGMFRGIFTDLSQDGLAKEMLECPWEEQKATCEDYQQERRAQRYQVEQSRFSMEGYEQDLDLQDDYIFQCAMAMKPHWMSQKGIDDSEETLSDRLQKLNLENSEEKEGSSFFDEQERLLLSTIPYPLLPPTSDLSAQEESSLVLGLIDILLAYIYDHLTTDGDPTVESSWCISTLSATLAWLEDWKQPDDSVDTVLRSFLRRSLVYPYIRNLDFSLYVLTHLRLILENPRSVIRCLLQVRTILEESESYYLGNKLFVAPYLLWIQQNIDGLGVKFKNVANAIEKIQSETNLSDPEQLGLPIELDASSSSCKESTTSSDDDDDEYSSSSSLSSREDESQTVEQAPVPSETIAARSPVTNRSSALLDENLGARLSSLKLETDNLPVQEGKKNSVLVEEL